MKKQHTQMSAICGLTAWLAIAAISHAATTIGAWELNGNLDNSIGGGAALGATGWTATFTSVIIAGSASDVLVVPALTSSQRLGFFNSIAANGGGSRTNDFSIGWDVNFRTLQTVESLLQTNSSNSDDVDVYRRSTGAIVGPGGLTELAPAGSVVADTWYRIVMTSLNDGGGLNHVKFYINGVQTNSPDTTYAINSVISLSPSASNFIFTDNSGETGDAYLNSFALWDGALSPSEVASMGSASSSGFNVPEPSTTLFGIVGVLALFVRRRRQ